MCLLSSPLKKVLRDLLKEMWWAACLTWLEYCLMFFSARNITQSYEMNELNELFVINVSVYCVTFLIKSYESSF